MRSFRRPAAAVGALALTGAALATATPAAGATTPPVRPVAAVDLARYAGHWYQVAAVPQLFEIQCAKDVTADYTPQPDGTIKVVNSCDQWFGLGPSTIEGRAKPSVAGSTSQLAVSFLQFGGSWSYLFAGTYWVIGLDRDYRWAVVGDPQRSSGFVLSRTPAVTAAQATAITAVLRANGYDPCNLRTTVQTGGLSTSTPACRPT